MVSHRRGPLRLVGRPYPPSHRVSSPLTVDCLAGRHILMTGKEIIAILLSKGCVIVRHRGSHVLVRCGNCQAPVPVHAGQTIGRGLLRTIERQFEPCLGERWLSK